ncbi:MAG TPA: MFS transporter, partial [Ktedonobacterales bacterium]
MLVTLRQRNFALILVGSFISLIGDWMLLVGLPLRVYTLTHSTLSTSIAFMVGALPTLLVGQLAGVFVDRWNRKHILIVANLLLALNLLPLLLVISARDVWIVYLVQFVAALVGQFLQPAAGAMLPTLVAEEMLVPANALNGLTTNLARLIGPSLGGAVVAFLGLQGIALLDAVSFLVAGAMAALVMLPSRSKTILSTDGEASH